MCFAQANNHQVQLIRIFFIPGSRRNWEHRRQGACSVCSGAVLALHQNTTEPKRTRALCHNRVCTPGDWDIYTCPGQPQLPHHPQCLWFLLAISACQQDSVYRRYKLAMKLSTPCWRLSKTPARLDEDVRKHVLANKVQPEYSFHVRVTPENRWSLKSLPNETILWFHEKSWGRSCKASRSSGHAGGQGGGMWKPGMCAC